MNEIVADKKIKNNEIFCYYFKYNNPLFLAKDLVRTKQAKTEKLVNNINDGLIHLRYAVIGKEIPENQNSINNKKVKELKY